MSQSPYIQFTPARRSAKRKGGGLRACIFLFFLSAAVSLSAQGLPTGEVDVIKQFEARLIETEKIDLRPELPPLDSMTKRQTYTITARTLNVAYPPPKIKPLALEKTDQAPVYKGFARIGGGFPKAFLGEGGYTVNRENLNVNLNLRHQSADNTPNLENQRFSNNRFGLDGTYYSDLGFGVRARTGFTQNNVFFYGYNGFGGDSTGISFASDDVRQRFSTFNLGAEVFNSKRTQADFEYGAAFDLYHLQDLFSARENGVDLRIRATKWFEDRHPLQLQIRGDFTGFRDTAKQSLNNIYLQPSYTFHADRFRAKVGLNLVSSGDEFFFFPDIEVGFNVVESLITAYAGANGSLQKNNFRNLSEYNPFVSSRPGLRNTNYNYYYGGIKGQFLGISYQAEAGFKQAKDLALFLANTDTVPRFDVLYDTVDIVTVKGSLTMPLFNKLDLTGTFTQSLFSPRNEEKAWHLPSMSVNVMAKYRMLADRLHLRGDLFLENGVPYRDENGKARNLNALFDISAGAEYFFTDQIGAFVQVNNLLNNRRERWQHYPVMGLNALVGLSAKF